MCSFMRQPLKWPACAPSAKASVYRSTFSRMPEARKPSICKRHSIKAATEMKVLRRVLLFQERTMAIVTWRLRGL